FSMEENMKRWVNFAAGTVLAFAVAGCGTSPNPTPMKDMAMSPDIAMAPPDMVTPNTGHGTGGKCTTANDCAFGPQGPTKQKGQCFRTTMLQGGATLTWINGYCTSP